MRKRLTGLMQTAYDRYIPDALRDSPDSYYRARSVVFFCAVTSLILLMFVLARFFLQGLHPYPLTLVGVIGCLLFAPSLMRRRGQIYPAGVVISMGGTLGFFTMSWLDGGTVSPSVFGIIVMPLLAMFFGNQRLGLINAGMVSVLMILLYVGTLNGWAYPVPFDDVTYQSLFVASQLAVMAVLLSIAYLFLTWQLNVREGLLIANQAKDEFLSGMSHELRTPLNSMMGFTDVLLHEYAGPLNDAQKDNLRLVMNSGEHLTELVEDLVNLTNIDAGKVTLAPTRIDIVSLIRTCIDSFSVDSAARNVDIQIHVGDVPASINADDTRVRQIIGNLISNALKFSPDEGIINIGVERNGPIIEIGVTDSGKGVPAEHAERIFEKFYQAESALSGKTVGSGLGLYIARRLAEMHGGRLYLDRASQQQSGARFVLTIPIAGEAAAS